MTSSQLSLEIIEGAAVRAAGDELLALSRAVFPDFAADYLIDRLAHIDAPAAVLARAPDRRLVGFKLGYRRGSTLFYSWLGGIHPEARRQGLARRLMAAQHDWARSCGYRAVETRTRASNNAMIILNLQSGFQVVGFEVDRHGQAIVTQRLVFE